MYQIVGRDGQIYGPVGVEELKVWHAQGRFDRNTIVIDPITSQSGPAFLMLSDYDVLPPPLPPVEPNRTTADPGWTRPMPGGPISPLSPQAQPELGTRFLGMFLDGLVAVPLGALGSVPVLGLIGAPLLCLYWLFRDAFGGRSIGKRLTGTQVVRVDGRPIGAGQSVVRNLLYLPMLLLAIPVLGDLAWGIVAAFAILDDVLVLAGRRRLGDHLAGTVVVRYMG
jgi:uncharacterized RDD family membrane protein YckC